jgi:hypothetical protein
MPEATPPPLPSPTNAPVHLNETSITSDVLSYTILFGGLLTIAITLYMVMTTYSSLPFWDGWEGFRFAANGGSLFSPAWLWRLHNEHCMVIPKLFLAVDIRLFQGRQVFLLASIFAIQLMHLVLLSWSMHVLGGRRGALWRTGSGLAAFCLFCPSQYENFVWSFQVDFVLPHLLATLSFVALALYWAKLKVQPERQPSPRFLVISLLSALGATLSFASGILLWPLLVLAAVSLRLRVRAILSFLAVGAASISAYLYCYLRSESPAGPMRSLREPFNVLQYFLRYFLSSWPQFGIHHQDFIIMLVVLLLLLPVISYVRSFRALSIQLVLTIFYCLATALITAVGRVNLGVSQAASSRYQTVALLFWCSLGLLWLGGAFLARLQHSYLGAQICLLVIFAAAALKTNGPLEQAQRRAFGLKAATAALLTGVNDPVSLSWVYPDAELFATTVPYMRANRLSVFSDRLASVLRKPLESVFSVANPNECSGALESVLPLNDLNGPALGPGQRMRGWVSGRGRQRLPLTVVATTNGTIVGVGATTKWLPYVHDAPVRLPSHYGGFVAYAPRLSSGSTAELYAILRRTPPSACYIDQLNRFH